MQSYHRPISDPLASRDCTRRCLLSVLLVCIFPFTSPSSSYCSLQTEKLVSPAAWHVAGQTHSLTERSCPLCHPASATAISIINYPYSTASSVVQFIHFWVYRCMILVCCAEVLSFVSSYGCLKREKNKGIIYDTMMLMSFCS